MDTNLKSKWAADLLHHNRVWATVLGAASLLWFLLRVVPKPSRASYPCQRAAFPLASAFVLWLCASMGRVFSIVAMRRMVRRYRFAALGLAAMATIVASTWMWHSRSIKAAEIATHYNFVPQTRNVPMGEARGIFPGRVV